MNIKGMMEMAREIAVHVGDNGEAASLCENGKIVIYRKRQGGWDASKEAGFVLNKALGMKELREKLEDLLVFLGHCRVFAALSVTGVPYYELEKAGCSVWEIDGKPEDFLDDLLDQEEKALVRNAGQCSENTPPAPVEISGGCFSISLGEIQAGDSGFTSKQVLLPFLRKGAFYSLEVLCSHVPPWLEAEITRGNLSAQVLRTGKNEVKLTITKKQCSQCGE